MGFDRDADGSISFGELCHGLEIMGIQRNQVDLMHEFDKNNDGEVSVQEFVNWWFCHVKEARVVTVTSAGAWEEVLQGKPPPGIGELIMLQVTFTFCRTCR